MVQEVMPSPALAVEFIPNNKSAAKNERKISKIRTFMLSPPIPVVNIGINFCKIIIIVQTHTSGQDATFSDNTACISWSAEFLSLTSEAKM